jgi:TolA-binding protein
VSIDDELANESTPSQPLGYIKSQPRSMISNPVSSTLVQSDYLNADTTKSRQFDPSEYRGIRKSEIERYERKSADRPKTSTVRKKRTTATRRSTSTRANSARVRKSPSVTGKSERHYGSFETPSTTFRKRTQMTTTQKGSAHDRAFTDGLALVRAGRYAEAVAPLSEAVKGSRFYRSTAHYYLAISYANSGNTTSAAPILNALKGGSGPLADKAWIAYARLLGVSGRRDLARTELVRFLRTRPSSTLSAEGRAALQQI